MRRRDGQAPPDEAPLSILQTDLIFIPNYSRPLKSSFTASLQLVNTCRNNIHISYNLLHPVEPRFIVSSLQPITFHSSNSASPICNKKNLSHHFSRCPHRAAAAAAAWQVPDWPPGARPAASRPRRRTTRTASANVGGSCYQHSLASLGTDTTQVLNLFHSLALRQKIDKLSSFVA